MNLTDGMLFKGTPSTLSKMDDLNLADGAQRAQPRRRDRLSGRKATHVPVTRLPHASGNPCWDTRAHEASLRQGASESGRRPGAHNRDARQVEHQAAIQKGGESFCRHLQKYAGNTRCGPAFMASNVLLPFSRLNKGGAHRKLRTSPSREGGDGRSRRLWTSLTVQLATGECRSNF